MKTSYEWLKDYCGFDLPAHELAARMSHAGLGVESYEPRDGDWMLDVEVKSNRPDCLCHLGLAREVAAITGGVATRPDFTLQQSGRSTAEAASLRVEAPELCPHYTARILEGVQVGPSPDWLQQRLITCGVRPVNNIVDITNYVMLECGQPLHAFDLALIGNQSIVVRSSRRGETITTIDGTEVELRGEECVIADATRPVALAGVMGGLKSEISEATSDILLEAARFDPASVRATSRLHRLASGSSYRFERGVDPEATDWASRRACALIGELAGGTVLGGALEERYDSTERPELTLRYPRLELVLGVEVPRQQVIQIFQSLELEVTDRRDDCVTVRVPSWRSDLEREVDLIEEVARIHGYDKISETTDMPVQAVTPSADQMAESRARHLLAGEGFSEVVTYSLVEPNPVQMAQPWHEGDPIAVRNPISTERTHLRLTQMANLLAVKRFNAAHGTPAVDLFQLGHIYLPQSGQQLPEEKLCLTMLTDREQGLRVLKGALANVLDELGVDEPPEESPGARGPFSHGESIELSLEGSVLGCAGTLSEELAEEFEFPGRPGLLEVDFGLLAGRARLAAPYRPVPEYPATARDLAVIVDEEVLWADLERCVRRHAPETLESVELFDVYRGEPVPAGLKSLAFSLTFRRTDGTITASEAQQARDAVLEALQRELGAQIRA